VPPTTRQRRVEAGRPRGWPPVSYWMRVTVGVLIVLALARILLALGDILVLVLISAILALGFQPAVMWLERRGLSRGWAVALGLFAGLLVIGLFLWLVLPDIIRQLGALQQDAPRILESAEQRFPFLKGLGERLQSETGGLGSLDLSGILDLAGSFTSLVLGALTVLVLTIYFTVRLPTMRTWMASLLHPEDRQEFEGILEESIQRVGGYVLGNLAISAIAGVTTFVALLLIGVPFAAALAFFTALMDLIPTVGALIAAIAATIVAAFVGVPQLIATAAFFLVYQQVENYLIQPRVMRRAIDMSAPMVILAVLIGGTLLGVIGALLALPVAAVIKVAFRELYLEDRREEVRSLG
jgi:predicted PurR-regulated permease PerM